MLMKPAVPCTTRSPTWHSRGSLANLVRHADERNPNRGQGGAALVEADARARIGHRDERDWPGLAAALLMNCPIWTEDNDLFGTGVPTWSTTTVEIYLKGH